MSKRCFNLRNCLLWCYLSQKYFNLLKANWFSSILHSLPPTTNLLFLNFISHIYIYIYLLNLSSLILRTYFKISYHLSHILFCHFVWRHNLFVNGILYLSFGEINHVLKSQERLNEINKSSTAKKQKTKNKKKKACSQFMSR